MKLTEQKRLHILDAAEKLFHRQGMLHTSMDQLATEAQVSKRTVYNHFATKELLFQAMLQRMFTQLAQVPEVQFSASEPIAQQLLRIALNETALLTSEPFLRVARVALLQLMQQPELAQTLSELAPGCQRYLGRFLQQATDAGVLAVKDIDFAAKQFIYQLKALVFYPALFGMPAADAAELNYITEQSVQMFLARYQA